MVRLKALHLSLLSSKLVYLGQSFLVACSPFLSPLRLPGQSLPMERKCWTSEDKLICFPWAEWGGPDPMTFDSNRSPKQQPRLLDISPLMGELSHSS